MPFKTQEQNNSWNLKEADDDRSRAAEVLSSPTPVCVSSWKTQCHKSPETENNSSIAAVSRNKICRAYHVERLTAMQKETAHCESFELQVVTADSQEFGRRPTIVTERPLTTEVGVLGGHDELREYEQVAQTPAIKETQGFLDYSDIINAVSEEGRNVTHTTTALTNGGQSDNSEREEKPLESEPSADMGTMATCFDCCFGQITGSGCRQTDSRTSHDVFQRTTPADGPCQSTDEAETDFETFHELHHVTNDQGCTDYRNKPEFRLQDDDCGQDYRPLHSEPFDTCSTDAGEANVNSGSFLPNQQEAGRLLETKMPDSYAPLRREELDVQSSSFIDGQKIDENVDNCNTNSQTTQAASLRQQEQKDGKERSDGDLLSQSLVVTADERTDFETTSRSDQEHRYDSCGRPLTTGKQTTADTSENPNAPVMTAADVDNARPRNSDMVTRAAQSQYTIREASPHATSPASQPANNQRDKPPKSQLSRIQQQAAIVNPARSESLRVSSPVIQIQRGTGDHPEGPFVSRESLLRVFDEKNDKFFGRDEKSLEILEVACTNGECMETMCADRSSSSNQNGTGEETKKCQNAFTISYSTNEKEKGRTAKHEPTEQNGDDDLKIDDSAENRPIMNRLKPRNLGQGQQGNIFKASETENIGQSKDQHCHNELKGSFDNGFWNFFTSLTFCQLILRCSALWERSRRRQQSRVKKRRPSSMPYGLEFR
jgi:hypothetical protein